MKNTDLAYLAGIIDGEGTIGFYHSTSTPKGQPRIVVAMKTEQPVKWIYKKFGGRYRHVFIKHKSGYLEERYRWGTYEGERVKVILELCMPYLKTKKNKAKEVLQLIEGKSLTHKDME